MIGWCGDPVTTAERSRAALYYTAYDQAYRYVRDHPHRFRVKLTAYAGADPKECDKVAVTLVNAPASIMAALQALHAELYERRRWRV